jgi:poly-gamma-glutamate synthesis protein (capsule biosynthesis protein)
MVGGMAEVTIAMDENGEVSIQDYGVEAVVCHLTEGTNGVTVYPLSEYRDELAEENAIVAQDGNFSKEYCVQLCDDVWGAGMWH